MKHLRVLIFSATFGAGHVRAAEALVEALREEDPVTEITHLDFGAFISKTFNSVIKSTYIELIKHTPKLWGKFYYRTAKIPPHSVFQRFLNGIGRRELVKYIRSLQPDLIICTYPTVAGVLSDLKRKKALDIPLVTVVTDYAVHSQWVHQGIDLYIVGSQDVHQGLVTRGIHADKIRVTGIPVSPRFERAIDRQGIAGKLGLDPGKITFLVMGGAYGVLMGAKRVCQFLADSEVPVQSIMVCGRDEKLYKSLDTVVAEARNPVVRFGFINNVEELMAVSDLIITKAGGLTVSEALTKRLPLIIFKPIPGQEEENAIFLEKVGAGRIAHTEEELESILRELLHFPDRMEDMRQAAAQVLPGRSAGKAVEYMLELVHEQGTRQKIG
ncbi:MAG: MGDG synthase family glycosyltransferase [Desulfitobacteriaceae bacterium]